MLRLTSEVRQGVIGAVLELGCVHKHRVLNEGPEGDGGRGALSVLY